MDEMDNTTQSSIPPPPPPPTPGTNVPFANGAFLQEEKLKLAAMSRLTAVKSAANWYYWIAGLSIINTLAALLQWKFSFVVGLGATQLVDGIGQYGAKHGGTGIVIAIALVLNAIIAGIYVMFGIFASKRQKWAFITGMVLYGLDGLIFIFFSAWLSLAFHGYALYCIFRGYQANDQLVQIEQQLNASRVRQISGG